MKFIKDILFFDLQTTGQDADKDQVIQLSSILLDKDNLLEKDYFNSYIRVSYLDSVMHHHAQLAGVDVDIIKQSQKIYDVIKNFHKKFSTNLILATHNFSNILFLKSAFKKAAVPFDYDPHVLHLWTLGYIYTLNYGLKKMPTLDTFINYFKLKLNRPYDSMEKVKIEVEIFRKIIKEV